MRSQNFPRVLQYIILTGLIYVNAKFILVINESRSTKTNENITGKHIPQTKVERLKITNSKPNTLKSSPKGVPKTANLQSASILTPNSNKRKRNADPPINLAIVGHVDAGKSTLLGHLLFLLEAVDVKTLHRHKQNASNIGKGSFAFAWILDETTEERERGVTMDVSSASLSIKNKKFNFLDTPGHKDFVPNMINGVSLADAALLVVNAVKGEFEAGFDHGGQTREHLLLLKALGISNVIVVINKMDSLDWSHDRFVEIQNILSTYLRHIGIENFHFVPVSGLHGTNITNSPESSHPLARWIPKSRCLIDVMLERFEPPMTLDDQPLRIVIDNVLKCSNDLLNASAKVVSGSVEIGDKLFLVPDAISVVVKTLSIDDAPLVKGACFVGDRIQISLNGQFEPDSIAPGSVLSRGGSELVPFTNKFYAKIVTFDLKVPIMPGSQAELFLHSQRVSCRFLTLESIIEKTSKSIARNKPRVLPKNSAALVQICTDVNICVEPFSKKNKSMGRIAFRLNGQTIAVGIIEKIVNSTSFT